MVVCVEEAGRDWMETAQRRGGATSRQAIGSGKSPCEAEREAASSERGGEKEDAMGSTMGGHEEGQ